MVYNTPDTVYYKESQRLLKMLLFALFPFLTFRIPSLVKKQKALFEKELKKNDKPSYVPIL